VEKFWTAVVFALIFVLGDVVGVSGIVEIFNRIVALF